MNSKPANPFSSDPADSGRNPGQNPVQIPAPDSAPNPAVNREPNPRNAPAGGPWTLPRYTDGFPYPDPNAPRDDSRPRPAPWVPDPPLLTESELENPQYDDLTDLLDIAHSSELRLKRLMHHDNRNFDHIDKLNEGVQTLWRLVAIRKALYRLDQEMKNPKSPTPAGRQADEEADAELFGVQASARTSSSSQPGPAAPHDSNDASGNSVAQAPSPVMNPDFSSPSAPSAFSAVKVDSSSISIPQSAFPIPHSSMILPSPSLPAPNVGSVNDIPEIPAARIAGIAGIENFGALLDNLKASLASHEALQIKMGFPPIELPPLNQSTQATPSTLKPQSSGAPPNPSAPSRPAAAEKILPKRKPGNPDPPPS